MEKAVSCYKADRLVASTAFIRRLQYASFVLQGKNAANEAMDSVRTFDAWCCGVLSAPEQSQLCEFSGPTFGFITQKFSMVGGYTENLEKNNKTVKIGGWALARDNTVLTL